MENIARSLKVTKLQNQDINLGNMMYGQEWEVTER